MLHITVTSRASVTRVYIYMDPMMMLSSDVHTILYHTDYRIG